MEKGRGVDEKKKEKVQIDGSFQEVGQAGPVWLAVGVDCGEDCYDEYPHHLQDRQAREQQ